MTPLERLARVLIRIVAWLVAISSGVFMLVYLYRWEWNRAMICGLFFVAAELALASTAIMARLRKVEERLDDIGSRSAAPGPPSADDDRLGPFAWLQESHGETVFVPILLGVGVIISGIAWVIERVASASWSIGGDTAAARRLRRLRALGADGLGAPVPLVSGASAVQLRQPSLGQGRHLVTWTIMLLTVGVLIVAFVNVLAEVTMNRPDPPPAGPMTTYELQIELRDGSAVDAAIPETLWLSCRAHLSGHDAVVIGGADGRFVVQVRPSVGRNDDRRFVGCLEDVRLDRVLVDVVASQGVDG
jgi:hypothetical protein